MNWWIGWLRGLHKASRNGYVLFDRYHLDLLVDPRRYRYGGPAWLAALATRCMPHPDRVIFLDAAPEVLLSRKQEVDAPTLEASRAAYKKHGRSVSCFVEIDASQSLDLVVKEVLLAIA